MIPSLPSLFSVIATKWNFPVQTDAGFYPMNWIKPMSIWGLPSGCMCPGRFTKSLTSGQCLLQPDLGNQLMDEVRTFIRSSDKPVYGLRSHDGFWRFLVLRHSVAHDQWMVNIVTAEDDRKTVQPLADRLMDRYPKVVSVINNITSRKAGVAIGEFEHTLAGSDIISDKIAGFRV